MTIMSQPPGRRARVFLLGFACVQNALTGGLLFGFSALKPAVEKIQCSTVDVGEVFTISMSANMFAPLLLAGPILDLLGPRICSCVSTGLVGLGFILFGVSSMLPGCSASYFMPAMLLIGIGGPGSQCSLFHLANLFKARGLALNLITCCISVSFVIFELLVGFGSSSSLQLAFLVYGSLPLICMVIGFFVMPDSPYNRAEVLPESLLPTSSVDGQSLLSAGGFGAARPMNFIWRRRTAPRNLRDGDSFVVEDINTALFPSSALPQNQTGTTLYSQVFSTGFVKLTIYFVVVSFCANLFLGNMQDIAQATIHGSVDDAAATAASYVATFFRVSPLSSMLNPIVGYSIDRFGLHVILIMTLTLAVTYAFMLWLGSFLIGAALFSIFSTSYFSYTYSCLAFEFGFEYYGLLAGLVQSVGSVVLLLLQPRVRGAAATFGWSRVQLWQAVAVGSFGLLLLCWHLMQMVLLRLRAQRQLMNSIGNSGTSIQRQRGNDSPRCPQSPRTMRSYSDTDVTTLEGDSACRRRPNLFPNVDDILLIDGAHSHHSHAAYKLESPPGEKPVAPSQEPTGLVPPAVSGS